MDLVCLLHEWCEERGWTLYEIDGGIAWYGISVKRENSRYNTVVGIFRTRVKLPATNREDTMVDEIDKRFRKWDYFNVYDPEFFVKLEVALKRLLDGST